MAITSELQINTYLLSTGCGDRRVNGVIIPLTRGKFAIIDSIDADLAQFNWYAMPVKDTCYARRNLPGTQPQTTVYLHRVILSRMLGRPLEKKEKCDHRDLNGCNNTRANLHLATHAQNIRNQRLMDTNTSGFKGVWWDKRAQKWAAKISIYDRNIRLGHFDIPEEAHNAYCSAARQYFDEFARFE